MTTEKLYHQEGDEVREYTEAEYAQVETDKIEAKKMADIEAQKEADKATATAKLEALGLTADDLKALGL